MPRSLITYFVDTPYTLAMPRELVFYGHDKLAATDNITGRNELVFGSMYRGGKSSDWHINLANCILFQAHFEWKEQCLACGG
jgi:hypothetical protein